MNRYKKSRLVIIVSTLVIISLSLLFMTAQNGVQIPFFTDIARNSLAFIDNAIAKPVQFLSEQKENISDMLVTYQENKELKRRVSDLDNIVAENNSLKNENESLRQNLEMRETYMGKQMITAQVSVRTPNAWNQEILLNIGQQGGVTTDMLVVANGGLIGIIDSLNENSTTVKLLTNSDDFSKIAVKVSLNSMDIYGILSGYDTDSHSFIITQLNSSEEIPVGSNVVTSDLAGELPSNIQVGKVASVRINSSNLNRELYVTPAANFSNIYSVMVIGK